MSNINSLQSLINRDVVSAFVDWCCNQKGLQASSLASRLANVLAAVQKHPLMKGIDLSWFREIICSLPDDSAPLRARRKANKYVPYDILATVPARIRNTSKRTALEAAITARNELLISWLLKLPWRQRNIRECRIGDASSANVFTAEKPTMEHLALPATLEESMHVSPNLRFWQFAFCDVETKTGHSVLGVVPTDLVTLIEPYLSEHRPILCRAKAPGTLFVTDLGRPFSEADLYRLVVTLTLRYVGRPVNPHLFRDIFAYKWLEDNPEDYLTLSKILWHRNINTTLQIYGRNFDESNGAARIEMWLAKRRRNGGGEV